MVDFKRRIEWNCLTDLRLHRVALDQRLLDEILLSCLVLHTFFLQSCRGFHRVEVISPSLNSLSIEDGEIEDTPSLNISAPYLHHLYILFSMVGGKSLLGNISSLVRANIDFQGYSWQDHDSVEVVNGAREILERVRHVNELYVGLQFMKVVSMMAVNGWQLPQSRRELLIVSPECEYSISAIISLLESSPNLETMVTEGCAAEGDDVILEPAVEVDLACELLHLKSIRIRSFADYLDEQMLMLARILLKGGNNTRRDGDHD